MSRPHPLLLPAAMLAFAVITLGAFTRLSNAGLGCPDWPGCYGHPLVPETVVAAGSDAHARAWIEMIHRYAAGILGVLILTLAWLHRRDARMRPFAFGLVALLALQALLGMWTVTLKLMPLVVMAHLLGGLAILALLWLWRLRAQERTPRRGSPLAAAALALVVAQIALGGWTSANYAAAACPDLPRCRGAWWPDADFDAAFTLPQAQERGYEGGLHDDRARTAMHLSHRIGALLVFAAVGLLALRLAARRGRARRAALWLGLALLLQFSLGVANVLLQLPLAVAVAHTGGAALLLLTLLWARRALPRP